MMSWGKCSPNSNPSRSFLMLWRLSDQYMLWDIHRWFYWWFQRDEKRLRCEDLNRCVGLEIHWRYPRQFRRFSNTKAMLRRGWNIFHTILHQLQSTDNENDNVNNGEKKCQASTTELNLEKQFLRIITGIGGELRQCLHEEIQRDHLRLIGTCRCQDTSVRIDNEDDIECNQKGTGDDSDHMPD